MHRPPPIRLVSPPLQSPQPITSPRSKSVSPGPYYRINQPEGNGLNTIGGGTTPTSPLQVGVQAGGFLSIASPQRQPSFRRGPGPSFVVQGTAANSLIVNTPVTSALPSPPRSNPPSRASKSHVPRFSVVVPSEKRRANEEAKHEGPVLEEWQGVQEEGKNHTKMLCMGALRTLHITAAKRIEAYSAIDGGGDSLSHEELSDSSGDEEEETVQVLEMYTTENLKKRRKILIDPRIRDLLGVLWSCCKSHKGVAGGFVDKVEYVNLLKSVHRMMQPPPFDDREAQRMCEEDYEHDSKGDPGISKPRFFDGLFDLVDIWTSSTDPSQYIEMLTLIVESLAVTTADGTQSFIPLSNVRYVDFEEHQSISKVQKAAKKAGKRRRQPINPLLVRKQIASIYETVITTSSVAKKQAAGYTELYGRDGGRFDLFVAWYFIGQASCRQTATRRLKSLVRQLLAAAPICPRSRTIAFLMGIVLPERCRGPPDVARLHVLCEAEAGSLSDVQLSRMNLCKHFLVPLLEKFHRRDRKSVFTPAVGAAPTTGHAINGASSLSEFLCPSCTYGCYKPPVSKGGAKVTHASSPPGKGETSPKAAAAKSILRGNTKNNVSAQATSKQCSHEGHVYVNSAFFLEAAARGAPLCSKAQGSYRWSQFMVRLGKLVTVSTPVSALDGTIKTIATSSLVDVDEAMECLLPVWIEEERLRMYRRATAAVGMVGRLIRQRIVKRREQREAAAAAAAES